MKILLIRPHNRENVNTRLPESLNIRQGILPPLGISYIAGVLERAGHTVKIMDAIALNLTNDGMHRYICEFNPEIVGITVMTPTLFGALETAKIAKKSAAITVLGGPHLSIFPVETLSYPYVDYGINGEGEYAILELIKMLNGEIAPADVKGLIYKRNGNIYVNDPVIVEDIDSLPFPSYHLLPMNKYDSIIGYYPVSTMISTRGCPYKCSFCFKQPSDRKFRCRSPVRVVDEMEYLVGRYKIKEVMFYDDVMTLNRFHVASICEEILLRNLEVSWETPTRVEHIDKELLKLMKKAGCIRLRYGVESGDERILNIMNKGIDLQRVKETFKLTKSVGIGTFAYFMIGYAYETERTIKKTIDFALELNPDLAMFTVVTPLPQTLLFELAQKEGIIKDDYWRQFTLGNREGKRIPYFVPNAELWVKKAYRDFYFRPTYLLKKLFQIRSLNLLKKYFWAFQGICLTSNKGCH